VFVFRCTNYWSQHFDSLTGSGSGGSDNSHCDGGLHPPVEEKEKEKDSAGKLRYLPDSSFTCLLYGYTT